MSGRNRHPRIQGRPSDIRMSGIGSNMVLVDQKVPGRGGGEATRPGIWIIRGMREGRIAWDRPRQHTAEACLFHTEQLAKAIIIVSERSAQQNINSISGRGQAYGSPEGHLMGMSAATNRQGD